MQRSDDMQSLNRRILALEGAVERINTAFVRNDLGLPDYDGHRVDHVTRVARSKDMDGYLQEVTKFLLRGAIVVLFGILAYGLGPWLASLGGGR